MRLIHVVPAISPKLGAPAYVATLARYQAAQGIDTTIVTTNADPDGRLDVPLRTPVTVDGATCIFHDVTSIAGRYLLAPSMLETFRRAVPTCDLVHIHWLYNFSSVAAAHAALRADVPFVVQPHGSLDPHLRKKNRSVKRAYMATVGRAILERPSAVVFTAEQERLIAEYRPQRPEWVVPVGIDGARFARLPDRGRFRAAYPEVDGPFLFFLGRLSPQKGLDLLLGAFQKLLERRKDLWLVLAGPDYRGFRAEVEGLATRLGVRHRVLFPGLFDHEMKLAAFVDAELFVLSSYAENFGIVIIEALACGVPIVISDQVNIHRELAAEGMATVVRCTVPSVFEGIEAALADSDNRRRIASSGPAFVRANYTWDSIVPTLTDKYRELLHG